MTKRLDIYQVIEGKPYLVGWRSMEICCSCNLAHDTIYSIRTNKKTGKKELWCKATRNRQETQNLRRKSQRKSSGSSGTRKRRRI